MVRIKAYAGIPIPKPLAGEEIRAFVFPVDRVFDPQMNG